MSRFDTYRQRIEQMDRRRIGLVRAGVVAGSAALTVMIIWSSGFRLEMAMDAWKRLWAQPIFHAKLPKIPPPLQARAPHKEPDLLTAFPSIQWSATPQQLILTGTLLGRNSREGSAFIGIDARNAQTYSAGALLANGARLIEIYRDYVVLERGAQKARLYVQGRTGEAPKRRDARDLLRVGGAPPAPHQEVSSEVLTDYIRPSPVYDGPTLLGFQVYAGSKVGIFAQMGLQGGDVIKALDGQPLTDPEQAIDLLRELTHGTAMTALVIRKGEPESVPLDGALIAADLARAQQGAVAPLTAPPPTD